MLLNYSIDELGFTKPVYPGAEVCIRFTCKEKLPNDKRVIEKPEIPIAIGIKRGDDIEKGIVKWSVGFCETDEMTGVATILTMIARMK